MGFLAIESLETRTLFSQIPLFKVTSLVSDSTAVPALHHDKNLVDGWGLAVGPPTALWVATPWTDLRAAWWHVRRAARSGRDLSLPAATPRCPRSPAAAIGAGC